jgi:phospholipid/cholesterol/gamma-HCH transport system ATP-binding protein
MPPPLIELRDVHRRFDALVVLNGVSLSIQPGQSIVIIGASGSGKSVLLKHMVGLLRPDRGQVFFDGQRIDHLPERKLMRIRRRFGFLFQLGALFDSLSVAQNIAFPLLEHSSQSAAQVRQTVARKLALVGLDAFEDKMPGELSGGQRKRVALARAIAMDPEVILYDEPTTGLDPIRADVINSLIIRLKRELGMASVVVTHDMNSAFRVADRVVMLHDGRFIFDGTPAQVQQSTDPVVRRFVAGEADERELAAIRAPAANGR